MALLASDIAPAILAFAGGLVAGVFFARRRRAAGAGKIAATAGPGDSGLTALPDSGPGFAVLAEALREVVLVLDKDDRLVFFNSAARVIPGIEDAALRRDAAVLVRSADFLEHLRKVRAGAARPGAAEVLIRRGTFGAELALEAAFAPLPESAGFGTSALAVVMADVSRLRRLEGVRREFVANVSHDLRTPVTIVKGYADALVEDYAGMDDDSRLRFLEKIQRNTRRLHVLLEDLLELSSLEDGGSPLNPKPGALNDVLREIAEVLTDRLSEAKLSVILNLAADDLRVAVDAPKMSRVFQNLLENVLRYAAGAATSVKISTAINGELFEIRIEDDGPGVAQAEYEKVFERLYRAEKSRSTAGGGSGIGLSIVKHIVLAHDGSVRAEPARPKGFAVVITLPCR
jgi:two-component system, OmpR family, phosphate regulon sensor histidine kinase PhoR